MDIKLVLKHYTDADVLSVMLNNLDTNSSEIAENCGVREIKTDCNEVVGVQYNGDEVVIESNDLLQAICRILDR